MWTVTNREQNLLKKEMYDISTAFVNMHSKSDTKLCKKKKILPKLNGSGM